MNIFTSSSFPSPSTSPFEEIELTTIHPHVHDLKDRHFNSDFIKADKAPILLAESHPSASQSNFAAREMDPLLLFVWTVQKQVSHCVATSNAEGRKVCFRSLLGLLHPKDDPSNFYAIRAGKHWPRLPERGQLLHMALCLDSYSKYSYEARSIRVPDERLWSRMTPRGKGTFISQQGSTCPLSLTFMDLLNESRIIKAYLDLIDASYSLSHPEKTTMTFTVQQAVNYAVALLDFNLDSLTNYLATFLPKQKVAHTKAFLKARVMGTSESGGS